MSVEVRLIDSLKGKGLFATRRIEEGTTVFEEDPLVSCQFSWNAAYQYKACGHCLRPLETAEENARRLTGNPNLQLPFPECCTTDKTTIVSCEACGEHYCSENCYKTALEQYHRILCLQTTERNNVLPVEHLNEAWKQVHYPPETSSIMLIVRLLARVLQAPNRDAAVQETLQFCHRTVSECDSELVHKLLGDKFADQLTMLHCLLQAAVPNEGIEQFLTLDGFQSLLALIGTNGQGVGTSPFSQWVENVSKLQMTDDQRKSLDRSIDKIYEDMDANVGTFLDNEGVALYSLQSASNHSCMPNAEIKFLHNNHRLSLVATRDIEVGDEICISYLSECDLERSRHSRRKALMENYLFLCNCTKCEEQAEDEDVTSEEEESDEDMSE